MEAAPPEDVPGFVVPVHRALTEHILLGGAPRASRSLNGDAGRGDRARPAPVDRRPRDLGHRPHRFRSGRPRRDPQFVDVARRHLRIPTI
jgi:type IV secretory pathway TrbD component